MSKTRTLAGLVSDGNLLADGIISGSEIVGIAPTLKGTSISYPGNDLAADPAGAQTCTITGTGFADTPAVYVGGTIAPSVTYVSTTQITFTTPAKAAGTYDVYVVNPGGDTAIMVYGISYSGIPAWSTAAGNLGTVDASFTIQLQAAGDAPVTYALTSGSTLPTGVTLSSTGLITGTAIGTEQTFNFSVTATDAQLQDTPRSFSVSVSLADPYFRYTTLLLSGDGANAAQNNTFLDSSTNNFAITRNGNATQGTFTPYGSNWSNYFNGTSDYLSNTGSGTTYDLTGDFCVEGWFYFTSLTDFGVWGIQPANGQAGLRLTTENNLSVVLISGPGTSHAGPFASSVAPGIGQWNHIAVTRSGSAITLWLNGVSVGTGSSASWTGSNLPINIGRSLNYGNGVPYYMNGYISNFRVVKGSPVYTTAFTPPTTPLTAITNTQLLTCQSNRFKDNSANNFALTVSGTPSVQRFNPFGASTAYSTSTIGGSGYFDGTNDYLVTSGTGSFNPRNTFTVEFWTYPLVSVDAVSFFGSNTNNLFYIESFNGSIYIGDGSVNTIGGIPPPQLNRWTHFLLSFDGTSYRLFYNGVLQATSTTLLASNTITSFRIGEKNDGARDFAGYMCDDRVLVGTALYTSAFTPPTAPLTAITNTSLLLSYTNAGIFDNAMQNNLETSGNAQISTSVVKYGTGSIAFDGTGDYLQIPYSPNLQFGTGAYTIEFWINTTVTDAWIMFNAATDTGIRVFITSTGKIQLNEQVSNVDNVSTSTTSINNGAWHHIALSRASGAGTKIFIDGVSEAQQSAAYNFSNTSTLYIGTRSSLVLFFNGYIDDLRITKGFARYTANFTPPASAFKAK